MASWTAACIIAYMRDSKSPLPLIYRQPAFAAFDAFSLHVITASALETIGHNTRARTQPDTPGDMFFIQSSPRGVRPCRRVARHGRPYGRSPRRWLMVELADTAGAGRASLFVTASRMIGTLRNAVFREFWDFAQKVLKAGKVGAVLRFRPPTH